MFKYKNINKSSIQIKQENEAVKAQMIKYQADMEYIAKMTDVDLEEGEEDEQEI